MANHDELSEFLGDPGRRAASSLVQIAISLISQAGFAPGRLPKNTSFGETNNQPWLDLLAFHFLRGA
jgi:hypothetical protein